LLLFSEWLQNRTHTERPFRDFVGSGGCAVAKKIGRGRRIFPPSAARNDERRTGREIANRRSPDSSAGLPDELAEESPEAAAAPQEGPCPVQADSNTNLRPAPAAGWIFCPGQGISRRGFPLVGGRLDFRWQFSFTTAPRTH
jgi:hypothetical protein